MRIVDADALLEQTNKVDLHGDPYSDGMQKGIGIVAEWIEEAPTIETVELEALLKQLYRERSRLSRVDKDFEARMGGYNPSSFTAGFIYALERMVGWATSLEAERRTDATD